VAGVAYIRTDISSSASKYEENLLLAKGQGVAFSREDALAMRQVPNSENAYLALRYFINKIDSLRVDIDRVVTTDGEFLSEWKPFAAYLPTLLESSNMKYLVATEELKDCYELSLAEPIILPKWTLALCWLADIAAKKSDLRTSTELLVAAAKLSTMLEHDPDFESIRIRSEMAMAIDRELSLLITSHGKERAWQALIDQVLAILDRPYDLRPCYKYAHWLTLYKVQLALGEKRDPTFTDQLYGERLIPRYNKATMSRVHELYGKMLQQYPTDLHDFPAIIALNHKLFESGDYHEMSLKAFYYSLPYYASHIWGARLEEAQRNAVIQALAIQKGRLDASSGLPVTGRHSLDSDGNPIRMRKLSKGWVVYSVGNDGKDNGGDESKRFNKDWVVHLPK
jgi:hypothetical protein